MASLIQRLSLELSHDLQDPALVLNPALVVPYLELIEQQVGHDEHMEEVLELILTLFRQHQLQPNLQLKLLQILVKIGQTLQNANPHLNKILQIVLDHQIFCLQTCLSSLNETDLNDLELQQSFKELPVLSYLIKSYPKLFPRLTPDSIQEAENKLDRIGSTLLLLNEKMSDKETAILALFGMLSTILKDRPIILRILTDLVFNYDIKKSSLTRAIKAACFLSDVIFDASVISKILDDGFWNLISKGMESKESIDQKQSLYLLKRAVNVILNLKDTNFKHEQKLFKVIAIEEQRVMWEDYFLIIESIDEKQVHIIKQITSRINSLLQFVSVDLTEDRPIHLSWLFIIYKLLFRHQNAAVARWSLDFFLSSFRLECKNSSTMEYVVEFIANSLMESINNTKAFQRDISVPLEVNFCSFLKFWTRHEKSPNFFWKETLKGLIEVPWGPIPLFFVTQSLYAEIGEESSQNEILDHALVLKLVDFCVNKMRCQEPLLKCSAQFHILSLIMKCSRAKTVFKSDLEAAGFLNSFHGMRKVLVYKGNLWRACKKWFFRDLDFSFNENVEATLNLIASDMRRNVALIFALYYESQETLERSETIQRIKEELKESLFRPYNDRKQHLLLFLCDLCSIFAKPKRREGRGYLTYGSELDYNENFLKVHDENIANVAVNCFKIDNKIVELFFRCSSAKPEGLKPCIQGHLDRIVLLENDFEKCCLSLEVISQASRNPGHLQLIQEHFRDKPDLLLNILNLKFQQYHQTRVKMGNIIDKQFSIFNLILRGTKNGLTSQKNFFEILAKAEECLSFGGGECLASVQKTVQVCISHVDLISHPEIIPRIVEFCQLAFNVIFEVRKNDLFWPSITAFISLAFCDHLLECQDSRVADIQTKFLQDILHEADVVIGMGPILAKRLNKGSKSIGKLPSCLHSNVGPLVMFGNLYRRDQKLSRETNMLVIEMADDIDANYVEGSDHNSDCMVRVYAIDLLLHFFANVNPDDQKRILEDLLKHVNIVAGAKTRYFENSLIHLVKNRMLQAFLILSDKFHASTANYVMENLLQGITDESIQTSVRRYSEWIIIRIINKYPEPNLGLIMNSYNTAKSSRLGSIPSFLSIFFGLATLSSNLRDLDQWMETLSPWCMSQHFGTRICAQIYLKKLFQRIQTLKETEVAKKYEFVVSCVDQCVKMGNYEKNLAKQNEDFFFNAFDPDVNFNFFDICYEFPRLSGLVKEEWNSFKEVLRSTDFQDIKFKVVNGSSNFSQISVVDPVKPELNSKEMEVEGDASSVIQKKITPWQSMWHQFELFHDDQERKVAFPNLMLVASLIDKLPNLGGLCRTCEIFGVGDYVIGNKKCCQDKEFRNVSVTAQNWVSISEVPVLRLKPFLKEKKLEGYLIVGIEQTSESTSLDKFSFPEKTLLLLGNEKQGIPVELIQEVDICVEIPQKGLIRSFNVHVTGAIVLWEYVRQMSK